MPELPDIVVYIEALEQRILGQVLERVQVSSPFLLRTAVPPINTIEGRSVVELRRLGKRICVGFDDHLWLVLHLMIAGRLHWHDLLSTVSVRGRSTGSSKAQSSKSKSHHPKNRLAAFDFSNGRLTLTEAGTQRRASLHLLQGDDALENFNPGGAEIFEIDVDEFATVLTSSNHTLKRALTDPRLFSGIGNAYSDEILWHAQLSPVALTQKLKAEQIEVLFSATRSTLTKWIDLLRGELFKDQSSRPKVQGRKAKVPGVEIPVSTACGSGRVPNSKESLRAVTLNFPEKVTAFRPEMAVHGKYLQPCPRCDAKVQRIRYASNETNYCPNCQTGGKLLADRALSRLLRSDWPRSVDELEGLVKH